MQAPLNATSRRILNHLLVWKHSITVGDLAQEMGCSPRSVRYQIPVLRQWLAGHGVSLNACRQGLSLAMTEDLRAQLTDTVSAAGSYENKYSAQERQTMLLRRFVTSHGPVSTESLCALLGVTAPTIMKDLRALRTSINRRNVKILTVRKKGYRLSGAESDIRQVLVDAVVQVECEDVAAIGGKTWPGDISLAAIIRLCEPRDPAGAEKFLRDAIGEATGSLGVRYADSALTSLLVHLAVSIFRLTKGCSVQIDRQHLEYAKTCAEYKVVADTLNRMAHRFEVGVSESETAYLTIRFAGAKRIGGPPTRSPVNGLIRTIASEMADAAEKYLGRAFKDNELIEGLSLHLESVSRRLRYNLPVRNPLLNEFRSNYPVVFAAAEYSANVFRSSLGLMLPAEEIGYIAMHFGAAIERASRGSPNQRRVLLVCGSGLGTTKMISSQITSAFPQVHLVGTVSAAEIREEDIGNVDAVISTVRIRLASIPYVVVKPVLDHQDICRIEGLLSIIADAPVTLQLQNQATLMPMRFHRTAIRFNAECSDWKDAIRLSGDLLYSHRFCEKQYGEAMIRQILAYGSYVVVNGGVAFPHARPQDGVLKSGMCLIRLSAPVYFPNLVEVPVWTIVGLALMERFEPGQLDLLTGMALRGEGERLAKARTEQELHEVIKALIW